MCQYCDLLWAHYPVVNANVADPASLQIGDFPGLCNRSQLLHFLHIHILVSINDHVSALSRYCTCYAKFYTYYIVIMRDGSLCELLGSLLWRIWLITGV